jgi:molecular chaperone IbpA
MLLTKGHAMQTRDLSPLYRTLVGFDRISTLIDNAMRLDGAPGYPPFNVEQVGDDAFRIELAVAGFAEEELSIEYKENTLIVAGRKAPVEEARRFLHRGIAERSFERRFGLADYVRVQGATLENGILTVELVRELPETLKPRTIQIDTSKTAARRTPKPVKEVDAA